MSLSACLVVLHLIIYYVAKQDMDVVYPVIKASLNNIELLYSLRSLEKIEHWKVFIIGHKPDWVVNVEHIPFEDNKDKYQNLREKFKIITEINNLSDNFIYMNDDFYFIKKQKILNYHIWTIWEQLKYEDIKRRDKEESIYQKWLKYVRDLFWEDAMSFEAHTPMIMNKNKLKDLIKKYPDYIPSSLRTLYWNEYLLKSKWLIAPNYKDYLEKCTDCKCYDLKKLHIIKNQKLLSSQNSLSKLKEFKIFMDWLFPDESIYENNYTVKYEAPKKMIKVKLLRPIYPYKSWEIVEMELNKVYYFRNQLEIFDKSLILNKDLLYK